MEAVGGDDRVFSRIRSRNVIWRGSLPTIEKVDQYTVAYIWPDAYATAPLRMMATRPFHPEHYLAKFHVDFGDEAEKLAREGGYESWSQSFNDRSAERDGGGTRPVTLSANDIPMPVLDPWTLADESPDSELWQRNPYYWKVDTAGNQLPYVDQVLVPMFPKPEEQMPVKLMAGELDFTAGLNLLDLPVYKRNEESGGYQIVLMENGSSATEFGYVLNYTHKDPVLREIFNDVRFRQALSLAIDRQDMSDTLALRPVQAGGAHRPDPLDRLRGVDERGLPRPRPGPRQRPARRDGPGVGRRPQVAAAPRRQGAGLRGLLAGRLGRLLRGRHGADQQLLGRDRRQDDPEVHAGGAAA